MDRCCRESLSRSPATCTAGRWRRSIRSYTRRLVRGSRFAQPPITSEASEINSNQSCVPPLLSIADVLRGVEAVQEELHSPLHGHEEPVSVRAVEQDAADMRLHSHESVLRLRRHGHHPVQLHFPSHDRDHRGGRVSATDTFVVSRFSFPSLSLSAIRPFSFAI